MDELDQVEEVVDAQPEPDVAPEPAPESEPAPEEFDYEPSFLNDAPAPEAQPTPQAQPQQWSPQQVAAYNQQMHMQQPQVPQQEELLNSLVRDTRGTIGSIAEEQARQVASQMMNQALGPVAQQQQQFIQGQAQYHASMSDSAVRDMYKTKFTKDEAFASNERIRTRIDRAIAGLREQAMYQAMNGDPSGFAIFNNPTFADGVLNLAKTIEGHQPSAVSAASAPHVESVAPAAQQTIFELSPDQEEAVRRMGPGGRDRYIKALEDVKKHDDFEWDE